MTPPSPETRETAAALERHPLSHPFVPCKRPDGCHFEPIGMCHWAIDEVTPICGRFESEHRVARPSLRERHPLGHAYVHSYIGVCFEVVEPRFFGRPRLCGRPERDHNPGPSLRERLRAWLERVVKGEGWRWW